LPPFYLQNNFLNPLIKNRSKIADFDLFITILSHKTLNNCEKQHMNQN